MTVFLKCTHNILDAESPLQIVKKKSFADFMKVIAASK